MKCQIALGVVWAALALFSRTSSAGKPPDLVLTHGNVYTADSERSFASALAVRSGTIVYVGDDRTALAMVGSGTVVRDLRGATVLPGLIDSHIHVTDSLKPVGCDLDNAPVSLAQLAHFVRKCIRQFHVPRGEWVSVRQWNYASGNAPDSAHPTLRAALDAASKDHPIHLLGSDGHHGGFNSMALAGARNPAGEVVGLSARTLAADFSASRAMVGVDASGEPDGSVNETLQSSIDGPDEFAQEREDFRHVMADPQAVVRHLNAAGITGVLDASVAASRLPFYDRILERRRLTFRAVIAQFYEPGRYQQPDGSIDVARMVEQARAVREHFSGSGLVRADTIKLYADGGLEGNPLATPPTLPNAAVLTPYLQPRFAPGPAGYPVAVGYVDTASKACVEARASPPSTDADRAAFLRREGFHPSQCEISSGVLYQPPEVMNAFVGAFHRAGFALHIHVIGDRGTRAAIDALEAAYRDGGPDLHRDGLAHLELAHPDDVDRIGRNRLYVAFTYAWAYIDEEGDQAVIPFLDRVTDPGRSLHAEENYFDQNAYPVRAVLAKGGIPVGGSDAPVETRDPRPFVNITRAISRSLPGGPALNRRQAISLLDAIDSYTISGARFLGWDSIAGSLQIGKSADFVVLDRDIFALGERADFRRMEDTKVVETWFEGKRVYRRH
jgi:predicted amidohydrolase YtcJ